MKVLLPLSRVVLNAVMLVSLLLVSGCSEPPAVKVGPAKPVGPVGQVKGKVTIDGKPVPAGTTINFVDEKGRTGSATIDASGAFSASDVPAGAVSVFFTVAASMNPDGSLTPAGGGIPEKYLAAETSGEKLEVKEGAEAEYKLNMKAGG